MYTLLPPPPPPCRLPSSLWGAIFHLLKKALFSRRFSSKVGGRRVFPPTSTYSASWPLKWPGLLEGTVPGGYSSGSSFAPSSSPVHCHRDGRCPVASWTLRR